MPHGYTLVPLPLKKKTWELSGSWSSWKDSFKEILAFTWVDEQNYTENRRTQTIHLMFIDETMGTIKYQDTYQRHATLIENIKLMFDGVSKQWLLTWEEFATANDPRSLFYCTLDWNTSLSVVIPKLIDQAFDRHSSLGPVLLGIRILNSTNIMYVKSSLDDTSASDIRMYQLQGNLSIENTVDIIQAIKASAFMAEQTINFAVLEVEWNNNENMIIELGPITEVRSSRKVSWLNLTLPKIKKSSRRLRKEVKGKPYWRFAIATIPHLYNGVIWQHQLNIRVVADAYPYSHFDDDIIAGTEIIAGPKGGVQKQDNTIIVAVGLIKKEAIGLPEEQARPLRGGELLCLSQDGQVVQECKEEIVEQVELCLVGNTVIGVDRIQRRWRLWQWEPLAGKEQFTTVQWLDEGVVHAHVVTNHENSNPQGTQFWLVEEHPKGLVVSRREGQTLEETEEPITLTGWSLPYALERSVGEWDWPVKKGLIGHEDALLLIAADEQNRMVLYRVEAGTEER